MGAWGTGSFENDSAGDMFADYRSEGSKVISDLLMGVTDVADDEYIDRYEGAATIAAVEIVTACHGKPSPVLKSHVLEDMILHRADVVADHDLVTYAKEALPRVMVPNLSENYDLWLEAGPEDFEAFKANVADLGKRLGTLT